MGRAPRADLEIGDFYRKAGSPRVVGLDPPARMLRRVRRRVVLVHGFNSGSEGAARSYDRFRDRMHAVAPKFEQDIRTLTWPGQAAYWSAVDRAKTDSAKELADYLSRAPRQQPTELVFIAHSLGCRLVLEALRQLDPAVRAGLLAKTRLFLMAAAVPTRTLTVSGSLRGALIDWSQATIFYSRTDEVLSTAFPLGQWPEQRAFTEAVGWSGEPAALWGPRRHNMTGYLHGTYWKSETVAYRIAVALRSAESRPVTRQFLKTRRRPSREVSGRGLNRRDLARRSSP